MHRYIHKKDWKPVVKMPFTANHPCWQGQVLVAHAPYFYKLVILPWVELGEQLVDSGVSGVLFNLV